MKYRMIWVLAYKPNTKNKINDQSYMGIVS
jgi:hypothetical protein